MNEHPMTATEALERERQWLAEQEENPVTIPAFIVPLMVKALEMGGELASVWGFNNTGELPGYKIYRRVGTNSSVAIPDQPAEPKSELL